MHIRNCSFQCKSSSRKELASLSMPVQLAFCTKISQTYCITSIKWDTLCVLGLVCFKWSKITDADFRSGSLTLMFSVTEIVSATCLFLEISVCLYWKQQCTFSRSMVKVLPFMEMSKTNWNPSKPKTSVSSCPVVEYFPALKCNLRAVYERPWKLMAEKIE